MHTLIDIAAIMAGLFCLYKGGDLLVDKAVNLAKRLKVSKLLIGLTLVGFGTSVPELVTSIAAMYQGSPGIAVGNMVGSNIANILLILGTAGVVYPIVINRQSFKRDSAWLIGTAAAFSAASFGGTIGRPLACAFILMLVAYTLHSYFSEKRIHKDSTFEAPEPSSIGSDVFMAMIGIAVIVMGSKALLYGSINIAKAFGISDTFIGLSLVAVGTSLPELAASVMAAIKKQGDVAYGNIIGSNIYNITFIPGIAGLLIPIDIPETILRLDLWIMLAVSALLIGFAAAGYRLGRVKSVIFLALYVIYIAFLCHCEAIA